MRRAAALCLAVTRHAVTLTLPHAETSPLAVTALALPCMFFSCVSHLQASVLYFNLIWMWQSF